MQTCCLKDSKLSEAYLIIAIAKEARTEVETVHAFRQLGITNQDKSQNERPWEPLGTIDFGDAVIQNSHDFMFSLVDHDSSPY